MLDRVLLDANAILNAAFVPQSWSRLIVAKLVEQRKALFVGSRSLGEAVEVARTMAGDLRKRRDPAIDIEQFIRRVGAIEVHPSADPIEPEVIRVLRPRTQSVESMLTLLKGAMGNLETDRSA